jgi:signal transduction histidine kinase/PAS domain-containing protein
MKNARNSLPIGRHRSVLILVWLAAAVLLLLTWTHVNRLSNRAQERALSSAEQDLSNLTRLSQEHAYRTFRSADQVMRFVQARYLKEGDKLGLSDLTQRGIIDAEIFNQVGVIDAHGIYTLSNLPIKGHLDLSDREHFRVHVEKDTGELFISKPVIGRASGRWSIQLSRRISRPDGSFAGVVVVSIDPTYFTQFYSDLNLGPEGLNALFGLDGIAKARRVGEKVEFGTPAPNAPFLSLLQNKNEGSYRQVSTIDGIERLYFFRKVPRYPLVTVSGVDIKHLLRATAADNVGLRMQAAALSVLVVALSIALSYYLSLIQRESRARGLAQVQIQDHTDKLNTVFELSPDGFVSFDANYCVSFVNPAFVGMTGLDAKQIMGMHAHDFSAWLAGLCTSNDKFSGLQALQACAQLDTLSAHQTIELKVPSRRVLHAQLCLSSSKSVSQILYFRDITHETEVESLKSEFLATAAHELRTPMSGIFGFAEVLLTQENDPDVQREFLEIIYRQSKLMIQILNELLDLARIEARGSQDFVFTRLCLQDVVRDLLKSCPCPPGMPAPEFIAPEANTYVTADAGKLRQALTNIVSNAYKYSPAGGAVQIRIGTSDARGKDATASIHVSDQGIGMTPEQVNSVFTRFYRADASGKIPGTGLGMSITKEIVEHHKGSISITSTFGEGTLVSMHLPTQHPT